MAIFDERDYSQFADFPDDPTDPTDPTDPVPPPVATGGGDMASAGKPPVPPPGYVPPPYGGPTRPDVGAVPLFDAPDFVAPDPQDILNDPSYLWRVSQGERALQQSAAARGTLRTGGTLKGLIDYGQSAASQEYASAFDRATQTYGLQYRAAQDEYAPRLAQWGAENLANSAEFNRLWDMYLSNLNDQFRHDELVYNSGNETTSP